MTSNASHEPRKLVVAALVLALVCRSVGGSRFMKRTASSSAMDMPPPPVSWWKHPPPPPLHIQWPPHYVRHPPSPPPPPPVINDDPSPPPPPPSLSLTTPPPNAKGLHQSPPPPPDHDTPTVLNRRRLFRAGDDEQTVTESRRCTSRDPATGGALAPGGAPLARVPYYGGGGGGGYAPAGAPYPGVVSSPVSAPVPAPAPALSNGADDGPLSHEPASPPSLSGDNSTMAHTTMVSAMKLNQCTYTIITSTGSIEGAGTQADVNVELFDKRGSSVLFVNLRSQSSRNFDQGATDTFTVVGDCVHSICKLRLSHDDSGPSPGWFVNTVTVSVLYQTHVFNVFEWLAKDEPPYSLSRVVGSCPP